jgi:hypothetical protein
MLAGRAPAISVLFFRRKVDVILRAPVAVHSCLPGLPPSAQRPIDKLTIYTRLPKPSTVLPSALSAVNNQLLI